MNNNSLGRLNPLVIELGGHQRLGELSQVRFQSSCRWKEEKDETIVEVFSSTAGQGWMFFILLLSSSTSIRQLPSSHCSPACLGETAQWQCKTQREEYLVILHWFSYQVCIFANSWIYKWNANGKSTQYDSEICWLFTCVHNSVLLFVLLNSMMMLFISFSLFSLICHCVLSWRLHSLL